MCFYFTAQSNCSSATVKSCVALAFAASASAATAYLIIKVKLGYARL
jgi:hypothetical protein